MPSWSWWIEVVIFGTSKRASNHPEQLSVNGVICFLEVDEVYVRGGFPSSRNFLLQSAHGEQHVDR